MFKEKMAKNFQHALIQFTYVFLKLYHVLATLSGTGERVVNKTDKIFAFIAYTFKRKREIIFS